MWKWPMRVFRLTPLIGAAGVGAGGLARSVEIILLSVVVAYLFHVLVSLVVEVRSLGDSEIEVSQSHPHTGDRSRSGVDSRDPIVIWDTSKISVN